MRSGIHLFLSRLALAGVLLGGARGAIAGSGEDRYDVIVERNPFDLRRPGSGPEAQPAAVAAPARVQFKLTGLASLPSGGRRAYLVALRPGQQFPEYQSLAEGERAGELQIVSVDVNSRRASIRFQGEDSVLTFETHGIQAMSRPAYESYETSPNRRAAVK